MNIPPLIFILILILVSMGGGYWLGNRQAATTLKIYREVISDLRRDLDQKEATSGDKMLAEVNNEAEGSEESEKDEEQDSDDLIEHQELAFKERMKEEMVTLTNREGHSIRLKILSAGPDSAEIERDDGQRFLLNYKELSDVDRAFMEFVASKAPKTEPEFDLDQIDWDALFPP